MYTKTEFSIFVSRRPPMFIREEKLSLASNVISENILYDSEDIVYKTSRLDCPSVMETVKLGAMLHASWIKEP